MALSGHLERALTAEKNLKKEKEQGRLFSKSVAFPSGSFVLKILVTYNPRFYDL